MNFVKQGLRKEENVKQIEFKSINCIQLKINTYTNFAMLVLIHREFTLYVRYKAQYQLFYAIHFEY